MTNAKSKLDHLSPEEKKKLLAQLLQNKTKKSKLFPVSFAQQRLWFLQQLEPQNTAYNLPAALQLEGKLNIPVLEQSLDEIVKRHEILQTAFVAVDAQPKQTISSEIKLNLSVIDLKNIVKAKHESETKKIIKQEIQQTFNLEQAPLFRVKLLHLATNKYILLFTLHHIITDYYSMRVLIRELATIYQAKLKDQPSPLSNLELQYVDYSVWQRKWLESDNLKTQLAYWEKQLADAPPLLDLPTDYPRPKTQTFRGATRTFSLSPELSQALQRLSRKENVTLFITLLAGFQTLLHRYTQQTDILVGSTVANRDQEATKYLIGLFVNNLIFRTKFDHKHTFQQLLNQVKETALSAYEHQNLPYEYLVEQLQPERNLSYNPLFQVMFVLHNTATEKVELPDLTIDYLPIDNQTARFDLSLDMYETQSGLIGSFEYNTDLFKTDTIVRFISHFENLLLEVANHPKHSLSQIEFLTKAEKEKLLNNHHVVNYSQDYLVHQLIEVKAIENPQKLALITNNKSFSYTELNQQANQLAYYLRSRGVNHNTLVGIYLERNSDLIVSLLAVLKTGAAYVPLDPSYPTERIHYIINDAEISFLITGQNLNNLAFQLNHQLYIINLDQPQDQIQTQSNHNLNLKIKPQNLAYVIYTSGSTGSPKGVAVQHSSLLNFLYSMQQQPGITPDDKLLAVTTVSFDIAALEIYLPLITGATVVLADRETSMDGDKLSQTIISHHITIMQATPATWQMLIDADWQGSKDLKVLCGGEALPYTLARQLTPLSQQIWNLYGPTETTIWSSVYQLNCDNENLSDLVPIGKPIANTEFYILDSQLNLVPPGIPGELYIGGAALARGYLNRADLTAEKFIPNPVGVWHCQTPTCQTPTIYKTGDKARYLPNGEIEYGGRLDNQVKIRGFRIELGEIEALLRQHPSIQAAVVIADEQNLIAYYIAKGKTTSTTAIRSFLQQQLPPYMIPSLLAEVDSFPLTPNGKINRKALSLQDSIKTNFDQDLTIPKTATEEILLGIWTAILEQDKISTDANFFELGGHSLLATRVISQIRKVFSIELPLRNLFEHPTIVELAQNIEQEKQNQINDEPVYPIEIISRDEELPLSFAQQRQWFLEQLEPNSAAYNIYGAVKITGKLDIKKLQSCFNILVERQEILRTSFITVEGKPELKIGNYHSIKLQLIDLSSLSPIEKEQQIKKLKFIEAQQPFSLDQAPLMRVKLILTAAEEQILLLSLHHIIADGWSIGVLVEEIVGLYSRGKACQARTGVNPIQYVDYAAWQKKWLQGKVLESQLGYWQQQLQNTPAVSSFPSDYPRKTESATAAGIYRFNIDRHTTNHLKQISRNGQTTLFMTVLAGLYLLLHRYSGNDDLVIGTAISLRHGFAYANRNRSEFEDLIGLFANTLALRLKVVNNPSFTELLSQVRETSLAAYANSDLPFEQLVDKLELERSLSYTPLFQILIVWETQRQQKLEIDNLTWESVPRDTVAAVKFDLTFFLAETTEGINGTIEYNTALYAPQTITRLVKHFNNLLVSVANNPQQRLSEIVFLSSSETKQLLEQFNQTQADFSQDCLHQLFERQAQLTPNAVALSHQQQQLTYAQLNSRADSLAAYLQSLGVGVETKVGIMCDRHPDMIVALLAILKAGGCYIPLDPKYPQQRLDWILEDTQLSILLTQIRYESNFVDKNLTVVNLDSRRNVLRLYDASSAPNPKNLAYIIYTSGSTGKPKGVAIAHRSATTLCYWAKNTFSSSQLSGVLASTSICFDLSVFEIFVTLSCGGTIILAENALELPNLNPSVPITLINTVPSAARELWRINGIPDTVNTVNLAGEALPKDLVDKLYQQQHIQQVYNLYGPSEDTTYSTFTLTKAQDSKTPRIGKPIANTQTYILDRYLQPVPVGIPGELYLGGDGLARGYFNRPEITADKFIPNPFNHVRVWQCQTPTIYKTGDRAKYLPDGEIEYLGRIDNQIKIRGFRIELGEIETVLGDHPDIETAVVIAHEQRLIAYIIANSNKKEIPNTELKSFLQTQLPDYMIPSVFVLLDKFPLTPNGKIDRLALPDPEFTREDSSDLILPTNEAEEKLVKIWQELLGIEIGTTDNFFALGGDSILAIQVIAKANQVGLGLTPKNIFQYQTVAELAAVTGVNNSVKAQQGIVTGKVPLTPIQHWFFEQNLLDPHHWNQSVWLEVKPPLKLGLLEGAIAQLLIHHDALRLSFQLTEWGWEQVNQNTDITVPVICVDLSHCSQNTQQIEKLKIANGLQTSFHLGEAPSIRLAWFRLGENRADRLLIVAHHLIIDGVSWRIILEDLQTVYQQLERGKKILLPPKTTSWKQWAEQLQHTDFKSELNYWIGQHNQCAEVKYNSTVAESKTVAITLTETETQQLLREVPEAYQTQINDILLTALIQTWQELYQCDRLLIELESHGREDIIDHIDLSRTVGWFTTIYPLVLNLSTDDSIESNIKSVKEQIRAVPNRGIGYGILRYIKQQPELNNLTQAEIRFNYLGQTDRLFSKNAQFYPVSESAGKMRSLRDRRTCPIEIDSIILNEQLKLKWTYSTSNYSDAKMENITQTYRVKLQQLIKHCLAKDAGGYTPSDFIQMDFSQDELDDILDDL